MDKSRIFYCEPQKAFMSVGNCEDLRDRPVGKAAAGCQPKLIACERCTMYSLVDKNKVETVTVTEYLCGDRPVSIGV